MSHRFPFFVICLRFRCRRFADSADVLSTSSFENVFSAVDIFTFIRVDGDEGDSRRRECGFAVVGDEHARTRCRHERVDALQQQHGAEARCRPAHRLQPVCVDVPRIDFVSFLVNDEIHHRGQLSIYLRMADGKVPSIYGPSGDEPWM